MFFKSFTLDQFFGRHRIQYTSYLFGLIRGDTEPIDKQQGALPSFDGFLKRCHARYWWT